MQTSLVDKIKSRGYWIVKIRPTQFKKDLIPSLMECLRVIRESKVSLRAWDYPHVQREGRGLMNGLDWVESSTDWGEILEYWRFYQSGQFVHLFNCREDWTDPSRLQIRRLSSEPLPGGMLNIISTIDRVTEIYEFASRLTAKNLFEKEAYIDIALHGMKDRTLVVTDPMRELHIDYTCGIDEIPYARIVTVETLLAKSSELALENIRYFFERFNWPKDRIPIDVFKNDQYKLLNRLW
jgi:hypothetical protein